MSYPDVFFSLLGTAFCVCFGKAAFCLLGEKRRVVVLDVKLAGVPRVVHVGDWCWSAGAGGHRVTTPNA